MHSHGPFRGTRKYTEVALQAWFGVDQDITMLHCVLRKRGHSPVNTPFVAVRFTADVEALPYARNSRRLKPPPKAHAEVTATPPSCVPVAGVGRSLPPSLTVTRRQSGAPGSTVLVITAPLDRAVLSGTLTTC